MAQWVPMPGKYQSADEHENDVWIWREKVNLRFQKELEWESSHGLDKKGKSRLDLRCFRDS